MKLSDVTEWNGIGKYNSGKADEIATILNLFGNELKPEVKEWLYTEQKTRREEAITAFDNAIKAIKQESETL